jgi:hypothetical protein
VRFAYANLQRMGFPDTFKAQKALCWHLAPAEGFLFRDSSIYRLDKKIDW